MMKILHVIDSGGLYGAEKVLLHLMQEQVRMGLEPILASIGRPDIPEKPLEAEARRLGLRVQVFCMRPGPNVAGIFRVLDFARQERIDLLHSHGYKSNILFGLMPRRLRKLPMVVTVHGYTWTGGMNRMLFYQKLDSLGLRFVDRAVLVSHAMKDHPWVKKNPARFEVIENGIPLDSPEESGLLEDIAEFAAKGYCIGAVGRISREKGSDLLLEAVAELIREGRDIRLVLLGEGSLRQELQARANALGISDRLLVPGYVKDASMHLKHFDLFVLPSLTEGLPMVLLEAMVAGIPVVATRVGGIPRVLDEGRAGVLVPSGDRGELKRALAAVMDAPDSARTRANLAAERVRRCYSSRAMAARYLNIYGQFLPKDISGLAEVSACR